MSMSIICQDICFLFCLFDKIQCHCIQVLSVLFCDKYVGLRP